MRQMPSVLLARKRRYRSSLSRNRLADFTCWVVSWNRMATWRSDGSPMGEAKTSNQRPIAAEPWVNRCGCRVSATWPYACIQKSSSCGTISRAVRPIGVSNPVCRSKTALVSMKR